MSAFPLRLDEYFFPVFEVAANPEYVQGTPDSGRLNVATHAGALEDGPGRYFARCDIESTAESAAGARYRLRVQCFGAFTAPSLPADAAVALVQTAGATLLVGAAREAIAGITARAPWGALLLPLVVLQPPASAGEASTAESRTDSLAE